MAEIRNVDFHAGEKYRGDINGAIITITNVFTTSAPNGKSIYWVSYKGQDGKVWTTGLATMQRILLTKIAE